MLLLNCISFISLVSFGVGTRRVGRSDGLRIFKGTPFLIENAPYMAQYKTVSMDRLTSSMCGASIVHPQFLVFAAHCYRFDHIAHVRVGSAVRDEGTKYEVQDTFLHPHYVHSRTTFDYDIAVLKLRSKIKFSKQVGTINLAPTNMQLEEGDMMTAMGFGTTESGTSSNRLLKVDIPYIPTDKCRGYFGRVELTDNMICAGNYRGQDVCKGDSGGPLVFRGYLVGVVSFGTRGCMGGPSVYARVPALRDFIDGTIQQNL